MRPANVLRAEKTGRLVVVCIALVVLSSIFLSAGARLHRHGGLATGNVAGIVVFTVLFAALLGKRVWARWTLVALLGAAGFAVLSRTLPVLLEHPPTPDTIFASATGSIYLICSGILAGSNAINSFLLHKD